MRRNLLKLMILAVIMIGCIKSTTFANEKEKLSDMSNEEIIVTLEELGMEFPESYRSSEYFGTFVRSIVYNVEENPAWENCYNAKISYTIAEDIRNIVNKYYGVSIENVNRHNIATAYTLRSSSYTLQDSVCNVEWSDYYASQNCYGYAIGKGIAEDPGYKVNHSFSLSETVQTLAGYVAYDLRILGYGEAQCYATLPSNISSDRRVICVRIGGGDYHFMKLNLSSGKWEHKPGRTRPLVYLYSPWQKYWTNEAVNRYGDVVQPSITYNSSIYYIIY